MDSLWEWDSPEFPGLKRRIRSCRNRISGEIHYIRCVWKHRLRRRLKLAFFARSVKKAQKKSARTRAGNQNAKIKTRKSKRMNWDRHKKCILSFYHLKTRKLLSQWWLSESLQAIAMCFYLMPTYPRILIWTHYQLNLRKNEVGNNQWKSWLASPFHWLQLSEQKSCSVLPPANRSKFQTN